MGWGLTLQILAFPIIIGLTLAGAYYAQRIVARRALRQIAEHYGDQLRGAEYRWVNYLSHEDLATGWRALQRRQKGFLFVAPSRAVFITPAGKHQWVLREYPREHASVAAHGLKRRSLGLPPMLRLHAKDHTGYFTALSAFGAPDRKATRGLYERIRRHFSDAGELDGHLARQGWQRGLLGGCMALVLALIGFAIHAAMAMKPMAVPEAVAALGNDRLAWATRNELLVTDRGGTLKSTVRWREIGIVEGISDIAALDRDTLLVGDRASGRIQRCSLEQRECQRLSGSQGREPFIGAFALIRHAATNEIWVADTTRHRLHRLSRDGELLETFGDNGHLCFPNDLEIADNRLYIANTNHHRIAWLDLARPEQGLQSGWLTVAEGRNDVQCPQVSEDGYIRFLHRESPGGDTAKPFAEGSPGRVWPMKIARDGQGAWWLLNAANGMRDADLWRMQPQAGERRLALAGTGHDLAAMAAVDDAVLVADRAAPELLRVPLDGGAAEPFGDAALKAHFEELAAAERRRELRYIAALAGALVAFLIPVSLLLLQLKHRLRRLLELDPAVS